jgi:hypothetical protein
MIAAAAVAVGSDAIGARVVSAPAAIGFRIAQSAAGTAAAAEVVVATAAAEVVVVIAVVVGAAVGALAVLLHAVAERPTAANIAATAVDFNMLMTTSMCGAAG